MKEFYYKNQHIIKLHLKLMQRETAGTCIYFLTERVMNTKCDILHLNYELLSMCIRRTYQLEQPFPYCL